MIFVRFEKSHKPTKKYNAVFLDNKGKTKKVSFGDTRYQHYKDSTGLGAWSHLNHNDEKRRNLYRLRHFKVYHKSPKWSPAWLSWNFLW